VVALFLACSATGQEPTAIQPRPRPTGRKESIPNLRLDLKMVLVPITVTDAMDRPVTNLSRSHFRVLEDGVEQAIRSFSQDEAPVSIGLLIDTSGSMKGRLTASVESMRLLFQTRLPGDEYFAVQFADGPRLLGGFTTDPADIERQLGQLEAHGWTSLLDAMALGVNQMAYARNSRRVLLVLSDGNDNNSRYSPSEIRNMVMEGDVRVYAVGLGHRPRLLQKLAAETGGSVLFAQNVGELPDVVDKLSREIRTQYVVGYSSTSPLNDGKYHKVKIELLPPPGAPPLRASWRRGYYAPTQ
jgi:VWFA-related protein